MPIDGDDNMSIIAYALMSKEYHENVIKQMEIDQGEEGQFLIENNLLHPCNEMHFNLRLNSLEGVAEITKNRVSLAEAQKLYGDNNRFKITVFYQRQFEALRMWQGSREDFINSIAWSHKSTTKLGKSSFLFSHDKKYILKKLPEREFRMFLDFGPNYFKHINLSIFHNLPSMLVKVLGAYRISTKNRNTSSRTVSWVLLSENLGYNLKESYEDYDLKGTINDRRRLKPSQKSKTKMDLEFI